MENETSTRVKTIFRTIKNKDHPFVMMDRRPIENSELTWGAKGVLAYLLSRPDNWTVRLRDLCNRSPDGVYKIRGYLRELTSAGHIYRKKEVDPKTKRIVEYTLEVYELPFSSKPLTNLPHAVNLTLNDNESLTDNDFNDIGADAPGGLDWKFGHGQKVTTHDLELQREAEYRNSADLIAMGMGINSMVAYDIALSFMQIRRIVIPEGKVKGQRKAVREMIQSGVSGQHVKLAVEKLVGEGMTVVDLFSVAKTAEDIANQPAKIASERPEHQPVPPDPNEGKYVPSPLPKPKLVYQQAH